MDESGTPTILLKVSLGMLRWLREHRCLLHNPRELSESKPTVQGESQLLKVVLTFYTLWHV